jgi:hypothetical protein
MGDVVELYPDPPEESAPLLKTVLLRTDTGDGDCNVAFATVILTERTTRSLLARIKQFEQANAADSYLVEMVFFDLTPRLIRYGSQSSELLDVIEAPGPGFVVIDEYVDLRAATLAPARWSRMRVSSRGLSWVIRPRKHNVVVRTGMIPCAVVREAVEPA